MKRKIFQNEKCPLSFAGKLFPSVETFHEVYPPFSKLNVRNGYRLRARTSALVSQLDANKQRGCEVVAMAEVRMYGVVLPVISQRPRSQV